MEKVDLNYNSYLNSEKLLKYLARIDPSKLIEEKLIVFQNMLSFLTARDTQKQIENPKMQNLYKEAYRNAHDIFTSNQRLQLKKAFL